MLTTLAKLSGIGEESSKLTETIIFGPRTFKQKALYISLAQSIHIVSAYTSLTVGPSSTQNNLLAIQSSFSEKGLRLKPSNKGIGLPLALFAQILPCPPSTDQQQSPVQLSYATPSAGRRQSADKIFTLYSHPYKSYRQKSSQWYNLPLDSTEDCPPIWLTELPFIAVL